MVKTLHPLSEIVARISQADGDGVRLTHDGGGATSTAENSDAARLEPAAAVQRALAEPIEFPPLAASIVPGDRVAIAVDGAAPQLGDVVRGAVESLVSAGVEPNDISIVATDEQTIQLCRDALAKMETGPQFVVHDPGDDNNLCLVGTMRNGEPLLTNQAIFDADVVLPISCARLHARSVFESVYPRFSNAETIARYREPARHDRKKQVGKKNEIDDAGRLIGVLTAIQVVPGGGETAAHILAGDPQAVARQSEELCRQRWLLHGPHRVSLMIATVTGGAQSQTWENVGRALATAQELVTEDGAVAICSNLDEPPGKSLGHLFGGNDLDRVSRKISHETEADSWPAWQLARALQRGPVYFLSQLSADTVEDMGLAPVESLDDLVRLAGRYESFALVEDSQHAVVTIDGEADEQ